MLTAALLASVHKTGLLEALERGGGDVEKLAGELGLDPRGVWTVLEALTSLGYVEKNRDYRLSLKGQKLARKMGFLPHLMGLLKSWFDLPAVLKNGCPRKTEFEGEELEAFIAAMASRPERVLEEAVAICTSKMDLSGKKVLDLGGGPGRYSRKFRDAGARATLFDTPEVIDLIKERYDVSGLKLIKGDFTTSDFPGGLQGFDLVYLGNICHAYPPEENRELLEKVKSVLKPGGLVAVEDFVRGRSPSAAMFAVNMLVNTEKGGTWTEEEYRSWLEGAGFQGIEVFDLAEGESQLITAIA